MKLLAALFTSLLMVTSAVAQTGSAKTAAELNAEVAGNLASGQTPAITAAQLRQVLLDMVASSLGPTQGTTAAANTVLAGPTTGATAAPTYRTLVAADISGLNVNLPFPTATGFGATCNGIVNDTTAISAMLAAGGGLVPYAGICPTSIAFGSISGKIIGQGQITDVTPNKRGPFLTHLTSAPATFGNWDSVLTAFNGDLSHVQFAIEHVVTGATTLTQPTTGYHSTPEASAMASYFYNSSGWNNSTSSNVGRTSSVFSTEYGFQAGQGDMMMHLVGMTQTSTKPGATHFLASPAMSYLAGGSSAFVNGAYLQMLGDLNFRDNGFDVAAIPIVVNLIRNNATGELSTTWIGERFQTSGSKAVDAVWSFSGSAVRGLDLSAGTFASVSTVASVAIAAGGTGYVAGDKVSIAGGTAQQVTVLTVSTVDGSGAILTFATDRAGIYTTAPATLNQFVVVASTTSGAGTGATFTVQYVIGAAITLPINGAIYGGVSATNFPSTEKLNYYNVIGFPAGGIEIGSAGNNAAGAAGSEEILIGHANFALALQSIVMGSNGYDKARPNVLVFGGGQFLNTGDNQRVEQILFTNTSSITPARLFVRNSSSSTNSLPVQVNTVFHVRIKDCSAIDTTNGDAATWNMIQGQLSRAAGNVAYAGGGTGVTAPDFSTGAGSTASLTLSADTVSQNLRILWTAPNTNLWHVSCNAETLEIQ